MFRTMRLILIALVALSCGPSTSQAQDTTSAPIFKIHAGRYFRKDTPLSFEVPEARLTTSVAKALQTGPVALGVRFVSSTGATDPNRPDTVAQAERSGDGKVRVTWVLPDEISAGQEASYRLLGETLEVPAAWSIVEATPGAYDLKRGDRPVFRYNAAPVSNPAYKEIQNRDAYIHPSYSPSGALITGDFSTSHPHHRGFFLAYERTKTGTFTPDFWNIHLGSGKIHADGIDKPVVGPVTARFSARHRWEAKEKATGKGVVVLRERWDVQAYAVPGSPYWLFDLISTQQGVDRPLEVLPYRYGGMAYRGPEPFVKGLLDVLTSEGKHRKDGDQKPARWVDLTGPIADGSDRYAGAMIADHPFNPHYPNTVRIHPSTLPFFSFVPAYDQAVVIAVDAPTVFRYRVLIHDGHPDGGLDERVARDFAEPPVVTIE